MNSIQAEKYIDCAPSVFPSLLSSPVYGMPIIHVGTATPSSPSSSGNVMVLRALIIAGISQVWAPEKRQSLSLHTRSSCDNVKIFAGRGYSPYAPSDQTLATLNSLQTLLSMRSPWVGSLALLAPAHGFVAQSAVGRGGSSMLQAFVRPQAAGLRTAASAQGWRHEGLRLQRAAPRAVSAAAGTRMMAGGGQGL